LSAALALAIQLIPSGDVITLFPVPLAATAQNRLSDGDHVIENHWLSAALVRAVHVTPSGDVITLFPVPLLATAQNRFSDGAHVTLFQLLSAALVLDFQNLPASPESL
jgi:hypothetical protein